MRSTFIVANTGYVSQKADSRHGFRQETTQVALAISGTVFQALHLKETITISSLTHTPQHLANATPASTVLDSSERATRRLIITVFEVSKV